VQVVLRRCLAKDPRERFQTPAALVAALESAAGGSSSAARAAAAAQAPPASSAVPPARDGTAAPTSSQTMDLPLPTSPTPWATPRGVPGTPASAHSAAHNLPAALNSFVGREHEAAAVQRLLRGDGGGSGARLVTLTGAGGAGKTRLALRVAAAMLSDYPAGVRLVELAPLADPTVVRQAVAAALGVVETPGRPVVDAVAASVGLQRLLLVLDNCEHLVAACAALAETLLRACPNLQVLATSREALGVLGETVYRVPALAVPAAAPLPATRLAENEAVRLFVERAAAGSPGFTLTEQNAAAVAEICRRLDGLPLAIELAAARVRVLSATQIAARLDDRFRLLASGSHLALPHQQTLRASMDWSYDLLADDERQLLRRLAVFAGGWTLEAAETVCDFGLPICDFGLGERPAGERASGGALAQSKIQNPKSQMDVLDVLTGLVDKSLVTAGEGEPGGASGAGSGERRYGLLETVRQYAGEKLAAGGDADETRARHAAYFRDLAEAAEPELNGPEQAAWLSRLDREHDNLRAALRWALDGGDAETGLRVGSALAKFWTVRGHQTEGQRWLDAALERAATAVPAVAAVSDAHRARACYAAGRMARARRDYAAARRRYEESLARWRAVGDRQGIALALASLGGVAGDQGEMDTARGLYEESLELRRALGDRRGVAQTLHNLGMLAYGRADYATARALQEESLAQNRQLQDTGGVASALLMLGQTTGRQGEAARSVALCTESLELFRQVGNQLGIAMAQRALGQAALEAGDWARAEALLEESLASARALHDPWAEAAALLALANAVKGSGDLARAEALARQSLTLAGPLGTRRLLAMALETLAGTAAAAGRSARAARLFGAAEALRDAFGMPRPAPEQARYEDDVAAARAALGGEQFAVHWAAGRELSVEQALQEAAREDVEPPATDQS
jgi:non-specific serine/threonine protein kinase